MCYVRAILELQLPLANPFLHFLSDGAIFIFGLLGPGSFSTICQWSQFREVVGLAAG